MLTYKSEVKILMVVPYDRGLDKLPHVLNNCSAAMEFGRYSKRHDTLLQVIGEFIRTYLAASLVLHLH